MAKERKSGLRKVAGMALEAIGIILSILVAFAIENWDEELKKIEKEEIYLVSLHSDLIKDQNQLTRRIKDYEIKLSETVALMELLSGEGQIDQGLVITSIEDKLAYLFAYVPSNNTYQALESSGDIKFITNAELKILLFELDKSFQTNEQKGEIFMNYTNSDLWAGFLIEHVNYGTKTTDLGPGELRNQLYNRVKRYNKLIESYYYDMQGTLLKIQEVKLALEEELTEKEIEPKHNIEEIQVNEEKEIEQEEEELEDLLDDVM
ncbi:MAG: hypothetical protein CL840_20085 [Crocinitomicaceae bacterium]|nr:hypothetical protein [Crocinitomicaceae bacterium]|tara:strand:- start:1408 stop:2196 length:789 start_codon:yes stop_codon:yes gene_type:complete